ncbi:unnamed protein product, partial [Ostreobium quekettii]
VISGSLAFFIFKQQTNASAFVEDMTYGGGRYVGTGRAFALMHNPFVSLYVRYARTHLYFAGTLILLCVMLAMLGIPGYGPATFGTWMVAVSLTTAPFWFNPMQFNMDVTKTDYKMWTRWMKGEEVDPDSKLTWHTWHEKMMGNIRNASGNLTDHWLNGASAIMYNLFTNGILAIAAVSNLKIDEQVDWTPIDEMDGEDIRKIFLWLAVTLTISFVGVLCVILQTCFSDRGQTRALRIFKIFPFLFFIVASLSLIQAPDFLRTSDGKNGFRNLLLIYYADLQIAIIVLEVLQRTNPDRAGIRHLVDQAYYLLDYSIGLILFGFLFLFSLLGVFQVFQNTLLFNVTFARSMNTKELADAIGVDRDLDRQEDAGGRAGESMTLRERLTRLMSRGFDATYIPGGTPHADVQKEGNFTTTRTLSNASRKFGTEGKMALGSGTLHSVGFATDDAEAEHGSDIISLRPIPQSAIGAQQEDQSEVGEVDRDAGRSHRQ